MFAGLALPLPALRAQIVAAVDVIVHVARGIDGRRVVTAVAEVDGARPVSARGLAPVRTLLGWRSDGLVPVNVPVRPPRRAGVDVESAWRAC